MHEYLLQEYLPGFAITVFAELGVALFFGLWTLRQLSIVALVNLITHPTLHVVLWSAFWWHSRSAPLLVMLGLEVVVFLAEGAMLWRWLPMRPGKSFALSAVMNSTSGLIGLAIAL